MRKLLLPMLCVMVLFASCSDDDDNKTNEPVINKNYHTKEFIQDFKNEIKQVISLNTSQLPKTETLKGGTKITIPDNVFTKGGEVITGDFTIEVYEMLDPSSIILSGTNTNYESRWWSDGNSILESDGFIHIDVRQNGESVDQKLNGYINVEIPTEKEDKTFTRLWVGVDTAGVNKDQFAWIDPDFGDFDGRNMELPGAWANGSYFEFGLGKLGWCNCDIYWGENNGMTTIEVALTGNVGKLASYIALDGDTYVIFCAKGARVVNQLYTKLNETTVQSYANSMPIGKEGKMLAFSVKEGLFSYAEQDITITKDMKLILDLKQLTSKEELENKIKALDVYAE